MQVFSFSTQNQSFVFNIQEGISLAIPVSSNGPEAYGLGNPQFEPFSIPGFTASIKEGGSLNCEKLSFYPHGCATHTESLLHVDNLGLAMDVISIPAFMLAVLVSVSCEDINGDKVITQLPNFTEGFIPDAVIVRTLPNTKAKFTQNYTGTNPPYFSPDLFANLSAMGVKHILTDLPSVDREVDEGRLSAHKAFFNKRLDCTITELIFVPDAIEDGLYLLNLQYPKIATDAVPSNPIVFKLQNS